MANRKNSEDLRYNGLSVPKFEEGDSPKFWLEKFDKAGTLKKWSEEEKCIHFCFALGNHAEDWYTSLTEEVKNDFESLKAKFLERFDNNVDRVYSYSVFLELSQGADSVDSFIEKVLKCGRTLKKSEAEMMDKIIHGLNKEIKNFVIMKEAKSLEDVTKYARMGQSITKSENSQVCSVVSEKKNSDFHRQGNHSDRSQYYPQRRPFLADRGQRQDNFRDRRQRRPFQEMCEHCGPQFRPGGSVNGTCIRQKAKKGEMCDSNCQCGTGLRCYRPMSGVCCPPRLCYDEAYVIRQQKYWQNCMKSPSCALPP